MDKGDELEPLASGFSNKIDPACAPEGADPAVTGGHCRDLINPEDREAVDHLTAALGVHILNEPFEFEGWNIAEKICHLPCERSCSKNQDWIRRADHPCEIKMQTMI